MVQASLWIGDDSAGWPERPGSLWCAVVRIETPTTQHLSGRWQHAEV